MTTNSGNGRPTSRRELELQIKLIQRVSQLSGVPLSYATVAKIFQAPPVGKNDFKKGNLVRILWGLNKGDLANVVQEVDHEGIVMVELPTAEQLPFKVTGSEIGLQIIDRPESRATVIARGQFYEVGLPTDIEIKPGDTVTLNSETLQIVGKSPIKLGGEATTVRRLLPSGLCEINHRSIKQVMVVEALQGTLHPGDKVLLDGSGSIILEKIEGEQQQFVFTLDTNVEWSDIAGNDEAKEELIEAVEVSFQEPELFKALNKPVLKGVLLWGPPGCGKTMLIKALATMLKKLHGNITGCLIYIKGPEILRGIVGDTETIIRQIFQQAREFQAKYGFPAIIFVDEAESLLPKRGSGISSDVEKTIVPAFLNEMNGLEDSGAIVILATNRPDILDPAAIRDGRIDLKLKIDRPTREAVRQIFFKHLSKIQLEEGLTAEILAAAATEEFFSANRVLYEISTRTRVKVGGEIQFKDELKLFTLAQIVNGAMIDGVINKATSLALRRARADKSQPCLKQEDVRLGIDRVQQENEKLDVKEALVEFSHDFKDQVIGIKQLHQGRL